MELTLSIIKPDAMDKIGKIISCIEEKKLQIVTMKIKHLTRKEAEMFYAVHKNAHFFDELVEFMISAPVLIQVLKGDNAVQVYRDLMGNTDPSKASQGTIRAMYSRSIGENSVHGSDSLQNAKREIQFFFSELELL